jgi:hypothetical protein
MAKKAKRRSEEQEAEEAFKFPEFDVNKFVEHEYEQARAMWVALGLAGALGAAAYLCDRFHLPLVLPIVLGIAVIIASPFIIRRLRSRSKEYTRGEWASLFMMQIFGWLGIWFLLLNVFPVTA